MADPTTLWEILNSEFAKSLSGSAMGALAGAAAGAWAAQYIAERVKVRDEVLRELRSTNAAVTLVFSVANAYLNLKTQHTQGMWEKFQQLKADAIAVQATGVPITVDVDLQSLDAPVVSMPEIKRIVIENITAPARAIALLDVLDRTIGQLTAFVGSQNAILADFKENGFDGYRYLGLRRGAIVDELYESTLKAIVSHTDECIFFSTNLVTELTKHGETLKARLPNQMGVTVTTTDFKNAAQHIPPADQFPDWEQENFKRTASAYPLGLNFWRSIPPDA